MRERTSHGRSSRGLQDASNAAARERTRSDARSRVSTQPSCVVVAADVGVRPFGVRRVLVLEAIAIARAVAARSRRRLALGVSAPSLARAPTSARISARYLERELRPSARRLHAEHHRAARGSAEHRGRDARRRDARLLQRRGVLGDLRRDDRAADRATAGSSGYGRRSYMPAPTSSAECRDSSAAVGRSRMEPIEDDLGAPGGHAEDLRCDLWRGAFRRPKKRNQYRSTTNRNFCL